MTQTVEYDVIEFREELLGRIETPIEALKRLLNARARDGWRLKNIVGLRVADEGLLLILERDVG
jgi:hypothetical protein